MGRQHQIVCIQAASLVSIPQSPYRLIHSNALIPNFHVVIKQEKKKQTKSQEKNQKASKSW